VVTAEHQRQMTVANGPGHELGHALTGLLDLIEIAHALVSDAGRLGHRGLDVAQVEASDSKLHQPSREPGVANGRRTHVDTPTSRAEVEAGADHRH
jgi:hypothetical protein